MSSSCCSRLLSSLWAMPLADSDCSTCGRRSVAGGGAAGGWDSAGQHQQLAATHSSDWQQVLWVRALLTRGRRAWVCQIGAPALALAAHLSTIGSAPRLRRLERAAQLHGALQRGDLLQFRAPLRPFVLRPVSRTAHPARNNHSPMHPDDPATAANRQEPSVAQVMTGPALPQPPRHAMERSSGVSSSFLTELDRNRAKSDWVAFAIGLVRGAGGGSACRHHEPGVFAAALGGGL